MSTQPNGPTGPTGPPPPPPTLADLLHVEMTPELRAKYIDLLGQHTNATNPPPQAIREEKPAPLPQGEADPEFSFDDLKILGADSKGKVYLQGRYYVAEDEDDPFKPCIIITTRRAFKKALDYWLDDKADYCERWGKLDGADGIAFCGVMGSMHALKCVELPEDNCCDLCPGFYEDNADPDDHSKWTPKPVRTFYVASFAEGCNMEHG